MNRKLFGAIVLTGAALGACRSGVLPEGGPRDLAVADLATRDQARPVDLAQPPVDMAGDLKECCWDIPAGGNLDLSGCIPVSCILI
jgi:hypothetical protein